MFPIVLAFTVPTLWFLLFHCMLLAIVQAKMPSFANQIMRRVRRIVYIFINALHIRLHEVSVFIQDALLEALDLTTRWTVYIHIAVGCAILGLAVFSDLQRVDHDDLPELVCIEEMRPELRDLGTSLISVSALFAAAQATRLHFFALLGLLLLSIGLLLIGQLPRLSGEAGGPADSRGIVVVIATILAVLIFASTWARRRDDMTMSVLFALCGIGGVPLAALLVAYGVPAAPCGMVLYGHWALGVLRALYTHYFGWVSACMLLVGLALITPATGDIINAGLRERHLDDFLYRPWAFVLRVGVWTAALVGRLQLELVRRLLDNFVGDEAVDWFDSVIAKINRASHFVGRA